MNLNSRIWLMWTWMTFIPLMMCFLYRYLTREISKHAQYPSDNIDFAIRIILFPALFYYIIDSFYLIYQIDKFGWCNFAFLLHHILTLAGFKASLTVVHFPWFFLAGFPCHSLLIMFPYQMELNYLYLAVILNFLYNS